MEAFNDRTKRIDFPYKPDAGELQMLYWHLDKLYDAPRIARSAHQRVADMFDYYGTEYDEDAGVVEYELAAEDPLHDGENAFFGRVIHEPIREFVNKVKSGDCGRNPGKISCPALLDTTGYAFFGLPPHL